MPLGLIARLRRHRGPAVLVLAILMAVQPSSAAGSGAGGAHAKPEFRRHDFVVICHGAGGAGSDPGLPPIRQDQHPCCLSVS